MQGWYAEYCTKTGQFCDQVIMKHSTKDKKTGDEIVYNVDSSSGYMTTPHTYSENQDDDIDQFYHTSSTTLAPTTRSRPEFTITTTERTIKKINRRQELVEKMRKMFHKLGQKYKKVKEKSVSNPDDLPPSSSSPTIVDFTTSPSIEDQPVTGTNVDPDFQLIEDDFDDFIPMEYEFVEDVIIENY